MPGMETGVPERTERRSAEQGRQPDEWQQVKQDIDALRQQGDAGKIAADLVMAHRLRGAAHYAPPEEDQFELERLFVTLIRAAALTFIEVRRQNAVTNDPGGSGEAAA